MLCPICGQILPYEIATRTASRQDCPSCRGELIINEYDEAYPSEKCDLWRIEFVANNPFDRMKSHGVWGDNCVASVVIAKLQELRASGRYSRGQLLPRAGEPLWMKD